jgi:hypothetical protein
MNDDANNDAGLPLPEDVSYLKTQCPLCDGAIEFPAAEFGTTANCPHCGKTIALGMPSDNETQNLPPLPREFATRPTGIPKSFADKIGLNWNLVVVTAIAIVCWSPMAAMLYQARDPLGTPKIPTRPSAEQFLNSRDTLGIEPKALEVPVLPAFGSPTKNQLSDADIGIAPNGLPAGKWSSTLQPINGWPNLYRDPSTGKKYRLLNGGIVEETSPYAGLTVEEMKAKIKLDSEISDSWAQQVRARQERFNQQQIIDELRRANDIAEENAIWQSSWQIENRPMYSQPIQLPTPVSPLPTTITSFDPNSLANPYGAGSPYKADGLMNPYSQYGSPYSSKSWRNPYATDTLAQNRGEILTLRTRQNFMTAKAITGEN